MNFESLMSLMHLFQEGFHNQKYQRDRQALDLHKDHHKSETPNQS